MNRSTPLALAALALLCSAVVAAPFPPSADAVKKREAIRRAEEARKQAQLQAELEALIALQRRLAADQAPDPRAVPQGPAVPDGYEMIVFAPHRPIRVAVTVRYEGKTVGERWRAALRTAYDYFDRNGDGSLNAAEAGNVFSDAGMAPMLQSGFYNPTQGVRPTIETLDLDRDGRVTFPEYAAYYKQSTARVLQAFAAIADNPINAQTTEALFKFFDRNGDGKLTRDEVTTVEKLVATKDADEDECLSFAELIPNFNDPRTGRIQVQPGGFSGAPAPPQGPQNAVVFELGRIPGTVIQRLFKEYDKDKDFELTQQESGFDDELFAKLDADRDGKLNGEELDAWRVGPSDIEVTLSLAPKAVDCQVEIKTDPKVIEARGFSIRRIESGRVILRSARQSVEFWAYGAVTPQGRQNVKQQFGPLFQAAAKGKDYVEDKDLTGPNAPNLQLIRVMFEPADADGNGKLTKTEFDRYLDLQQAFVDVGMSLSPAVQTPTLFGLLDENRDGRLSVRELRTAWDRLLALEEQGATVITRGIIQPTIALRLSRVVDRNLMNQQVAVFNPNVNVPVPTRGPMWFRKMDRNGDGDVSRFEFLGTRAEFDAIDADHDDLISLAEAEVHDTKMRGGK